MKKILIAVISMMLLISLCAISIHATDIAVLPPYTEELESLVIEAKKMRRGQYETTDEKWEYFEGSLDYAEELLAKENVPQTYIDNALNDLRYAISAIEMSYTPVNKDELMAKIEEAMSLEKKNYFVNQTRWDEFQEAIYFANVVLEDEDALQVEVEAARKSLRDWLLMLAKLRIEYGVNESDKATDITDVDDYPPIKDVIIPEEPIQRETNPKPTTSVWDGGVIELGCDASLAISALAIVGMIGAAALIKKNED